MRLRGMICNSYSLTLLGQKVMAGGGRPLVPGSVLTSTVTTPARNLLTVGRNMRSR